MSGAFDGAWPPFIAGPWMALLRFGKPLVTIRAEKLDMVAKATTRNMVTLKGFPIGAAARDTHWIVGSHSVESSLLPAFAVFVVWGHVRNSQVRMYS
jgi:hypothetical protein